MFIEKFWFVIYNIIVAPLIYTGFKIGTLFDKKMREGNYGRKGQHQRIVKALKNVSSLKTRILFHSTSVGEWEQAVPIIESIKQSNPDVFIVASFFSPSGYRFIKKHPAVDLKVYLPIDTYFAAYRFLRTIKPKLWIISKFDVWPNHVFAAKKLGIPTVMTAATLSPDSGRNKGLSKLLNKTVYKHFDYIFPISEDDKNRLLELYPNNEKLIVTGDTRFDQVYKKGEKTRLADEIAIFSNNYKLTFIAGSIWPADEKHLLPAIITIMKKFPDLNVILVPHELHESHISAIEQEMNTAGIESRRYTEFSSTEGTTKRIAIINTIGMLAKLYRLSDFAYIGGSFSTGVHNVMEPAVFGQPVIFGPRYLNSFEAGELMKIGSAFKVENQSEMEEKINSFIADETYRKEAGQKALHLIKNNLGATRKITQKLQEVYDFIS